MKNDTDTISRLLTAKESAVYLAISERKLWDMAKNGAIPAVRLGRAVRYDRQGLAFLFIGQKQG